MTILPIYKMIVLPGAKVWMQTKFYKEYAQKAAVLGERVAFLAQKEEKPRDQLSEDGF